MKIAHLTSVHLRYDTRIYHKMCCSLTALGKVYLVCADGKGNEVIKNIDITDVGKSKSRILRMFTSVNLIYKKAINLDADIYHLHDPELIRIGLKLIKKGKKVIFDSHELISDQILSKHYLPKFLRKTISKIYKYYEKYSLKKFHLIGATPYIRDHLKKINKDAIDICNYPILENHIIDNRDTNKQADKVNYICYVGGISKNRGIKELVEALELTNNKVVLNLAGNFESIAFEKEIRSLLGWRNVNYLGYLDRKEVNNVYAKSFAGIVTLHPTPAYINSLPVKMFEYMNFKLPIIASNFKLFCEIFDKIDCGLNVDPCNPKKIAEAIDEIFDNPKKSIKYGENGFRGVTDKFNWKNEEKKLYSFYDKILNIK
jgi:glycosyltransferase involved in cell wall biosynthesis